MEENGTTKITETKEKNQNDKTQNISTERFDDTPLDFSLRKRYREEETSSSESLNSPSSSTSHIDNVRSESENSFYSLYGNVKKEPPDKWDMIGEPRTTLQSSLVSNSTVMLPPYSAGVLYHSANALRTLPSLTSLVDSKYINQNSRPDSNKHSPTSPSPSGLGGYASPGYNPVPRFDSSVLQNLNLSPEEVLTIYRQQLEALKEQDKYQPGHLTRPSATPSPSFTSSSVPNMSLVHHHRAINNVISNGSPPISTHSLTATGHHSVGSRKRPRSLPDNQKDQAYWERRRKNNDAAKRSRDARRAKEDEIAIRAAILEQENLKLRVEVAALKTETAKLRCMLYNS